MSILRQISGIRVANVAGQCRWFKVGKSPRSNEVFLVPIESLNKEGNGETTILWETRQKQIEPTKITVRGALPGETVRVRVVSVFAKGKSALHTVRCLVFARRENLIRPRTDNEAWRSSLEEDLLPAGHQESRDYGAFDCPHFDRRHDEESCRGCAVPHLNYARQAIEKTKLLKSHLTGTLPPSFLPDLRVEPRSHIKRFANKFEMFAFSERPLGVPVWGQLSWKDPLPGERRDKYFVATPECRLISKSAQVVLKRMAQLIAVAHEANPSLFGVHNEVINKGTLRSAVIQTGTDQNNQKQVLLSIVTACSTNERFRTILKTEVADRLINEFPLLKGVNLIEAAVDTDRDADLFENPIPISGSPTIVDFIPSINKEISIGPSSPNALDTEVRAKLLGTLSFALSDLKSPRIIEMFGTKQSSVSGLLSDASPSVESYSESQIQLMLDQGSKPDNSFLAIPPPEQPKETVAQSKIETTEEVPIGAAVISFPRGYGKASVNGVTSKQFRHWIGNFVKPQRIIIMTDRFDGLRKDIGHLGLLGYEIRSIKALDARPGVMNKIAVIVILERKPNYQALRPHQLSMT